MSRHLVSVLAVTMVISIQSSSSASQVHYHAVKLPVAVGQANLVVIARWAEPFSSTVALDLKLPQGKRAAKASKASKASKGKRAPRYAKLLRHFVIEAVLHDRSGAKRGKGPRFARGKRIAVAQADWSLMFAMTRAYHLGQPVPSPSILHYKSGLTLDARVAKATLAKKRPRMILLLHADGKGEVRLAIAGGALPVSSRKRVEKLLRRR